MQQNGLFVLKTKSHHLFAVLKKAGLILPNGQTFLMQFFCSCLLQVGELYRCSWQAQQAQVTWQAYCTGAPLAVGTATRHAAGPATATVAPHQPIRVECLRLVLFKLLL